MPALKYFTALWTAFMYYTVSSILFGAAGVSAYNQLDGEKEKLLAGMRRLQALSEEFTGLKEALSYDADTISVYARELGYGGGGERFIRIAGLNGKQNARVSPGEMFIHADPEYVSDKTLRIVSIAIAFSIIICLVIVDILRFVKN